MAHSGPSPLRCQPLHHSSRPFSQALQVTFRAPRQARGQPSRKQMRQQSGGSQPWRRAPACCATADSTNLGRASSSFGARPTRQGVCVCWGCVGKVYPIPVWWIAHPRQLFSLCHIAGRAIWRRRATQSRVRLLCSRLFSIAESRQSRCGNASAHPLIHQLAMHHHARLSNLLSRRAARSILDLS